MMKSAIHSKIGGRNENQDSYQESISKFGKLIVVCDGMGGHAGGSIASKLAVDIIINDLKNPKSEDPRNALHNAIQKANFEIFRRTIKEPKLKGMGTTLTALLIQKEKAYACYVGDSRIYQFRRNKIVFKTTDHSKVTEMIKRGILSEEEARNHDDSNIILRAMGTTPVVDIDFHELDYKKGDRFLLCTDGIHDLIDEKTLIELVNTKGTIELTTQNLVNYVDSIGEKSNGTHDNLTAAIIEVLEDSISKTKYKIKPILPYVILISIVLGFIGYPLSKQVKNMFFGNSIEKQVIPLSFYHWDQLNERRAVFIDSIQILNEQLKCSRSKVIELSKQPIKKDSIERIDIITDSLNLI